MSFSAWAQVEQTFKYTALTSDSIQQNFLWLGTKGGIKSYDIDKKEWRLYPLVKEVNCLLVDTQNKNIIWAGTKSGLYIFSREKNAWLPASEYFPKLSSDKQTSSVFAASGISAITLDPFNPKKVFLATEKGLAYFDRETEVARFLTVADGLIADTLTCLALDEYTPNKIWLGSADGLMSLDIKELQVSRHLSQGDVPGDEIHTLAVNKDWVLVDNPKGGIAGYNKQGEFWDYYVPYEQIIWSDYKILALAYINYNNTPKLWVGTRSFGVFVIDEAAKAFSHLEEKGLSVTAFTLNQKDESPVWFGLQVCSGGGVGNYSFVDSSWWTTYPMVVLDNTYPVIWQEVQKDKQGFK